MVGFNSENYYLAFAERLFSLTCFSKFQSYFRTVRDDYLKAARQKISDPNILVNVVSRRVKQLKSGFKPLVESLEKLDPEDIALREIIDEKISYQLFESEEKV